MRCDLRVNLLVDYGWRCGLQCALKHSAAETPRPLSALAPSVVSGVDRVIRWGGHRRLSGFLPIQCAYADMQVQDFLGEFGWCLHLDVTLGG